MPAPPDTRGLFWRRRVFIVAAQPNCAVAKTLAHEAVAHHGLRELLGSKWHAFMAAVHRGTTAARDRPLRKLRDRVRKTYVNKRGRCDISPLVQADEVAAFAAEQHTDPWSGQFVARRGKMRERFGRVLQMLRQPRRGKLKLGYQHLVAALKASAKRLQERCASVREEARRRPGPGSMHRRRLWARAR